MSSESNALQVTSKSNACRKRQSGVHPERDAIRQNGIVIIMLLVSQINRNGEYQELPFLSLSIVLAVNSVVCALCNCPVHHNSGIYRPLESTTSPGFSELMICLLYVFPINRFRREVSRKSCRLCTPLPFSWHLQPSEIEKDCGLSTEECI